MRYALLDASGRLRAGWKVTAIPAAGWSNMLFVKHSGKLDDTRALTSRTADGGTLIVGADPEAIEELDGRIIPLFAVAFSLITAIGVLGAFLLSGALGRRLGAINRTADAIIGGDLTQRMPLSGTGDEFDRLSETLNQMLDRIAGLLDNLRQVSATSRMICAPRSPGCASGSILHWPAMPMRPHCAPRCSRRSSRPRTCLSCSPRS